VSRIQLFDAAGGVLDVSREELRPMVSLVADAVSLWVMVADGRRLAYAWAAAVALVMLGDGPDGFVQTVLIGCSGAEARGAECGVCC